MIYLIDDNRSKQQTKLYNCDFIENGEFKKLIRPIYKITNAQWINIEEELLKADAIFIHKTFSDVDKKGNFVDSKDTYNKIRTIFLNNDIPYVIFTRGSKGAEITEKNIKIIDKHLFYNNLYIFLKKYKINEVIQLELLAFGEKLFYYKAMILSNKIIDIIEKEKININEKLSFTYFENKIIDYFKITGSKISYDDFENKIKEWTYCKLINEIKKINNSILKYGKNIYY